MNFQLKTMRVRACAWEYVCVCFGHKYLMNISHACKKKWQRQKKSKRNSKKKKIQKNINHNCHEGQKWAARQRGCGWGGVAVWIFHFSWLLKARFCLNLQQQRVSLICLSRRVCASVCASVCANVCVCMLCVRARQLHDTALAWAASTASAPRSSYFSCCSSFSRPDICILSLVNYGLAI